MVKAILRISFILLAGASTADASPGEAARRAFEKGSRYFQAEEYEAALPYFEKAYALSERRPTAVFALAQCERALEMYEQAIVHFEEYLQSKPANAKDVEETIVLLKELAAKQRAEEAEARRQQQSTANAEQAGQAERARRRAAEARAKEEVEARRRSDRLGVAEPPPAPPPLNLIAAAPPPVVASDDDDSIWENPWLWVISGAVVVGAAVTTGVVLGTASSSDPNPYGGSTGVVLRP